MADKITKVEAVRRALAHFGRDAKPTPMQGWIRDQFNLQMGTNHISTAKGDILRKAGRPGKRAGPPTAEAKPGAVPAAPAAPGRGREAAIPLRDILYLKELVQRVGPGSLHTLIDALAK